MMVTIHTDKIHVNDKNIPLKAIFDRLYSNHNESIVIVAGSLVEGLGNTYSDLDILVLCDKLPEPDRFDSQRHNCNDFTWYARSVNKISGSWSTHDYYGEEGLHIDIEYIKLNSIMKDIDELNQRFEKLISTNHLLTTPFIRIPAFSNLKKQILHRIVTGLSLQSKEKLDQLRSIIDFKKLSLMNYLDIRLGYSNFKDIMGAYDINDYESTLYILKKRSLEQLRGLTHLCYDNNINDKWHVAYLRKYKETFPEIIEAISNALNYNPKTKGEKIALIKKIVSSIDLCFQTARHLIDQNFSNLVNRTDLSSAQRKLYSRKDLNHPQIRMALNYEERFYDVPSQPLTTFFK